MESGDWIGLSALAVALVSFGVNAYFTRHERRARMTEIDLLRRQVEGEATERDEPGISPIRVGSREKLIGVGVG
jgi:hypothetical protein